MEKETVTGENAMRVIEGKKPIEKQQDEASIMKEKELSNAYFILSLVDQYSIRDGKMVDRNIDEEVEYFAVKSVADISQELKALASDSNEESYEKVKNIHNNMDEFRMRDFVSLYERYSKLVYQHSLDTVNVEGAIDKVKKENEESSSKG